MLWSKIYLYNRRNNRWRSVTDDKQSYCIFDTHDSTRKRYAKLGLVCALSKKLLASIGHVST